jgi:HEAT repeat protein
MKTFEAIPALQKCLHDSSWWVRINASKALEGMGERGIAALRGSLESSDRFVHELSREVLLRNESTHNKVIGQA